MGCAERFLITRDNLPPMPEVARQLIASFDDEKVDIQTIVSLTSREQSLTLKVLRLANSARFTRSRAVTSLQDAAVLMGMEKLRNLVLAASIAGAFPRVSGLDRLAFWKHAIATGSYCQWLARILGADADSGYLAGFMLRSGELLIAQTLPDVVAEVEAGCTRPGMRMSLERRMLGCTHADITAELARRWQLPHRLVDGFVHTADPLEARPFSLLAAVMHLSDVMADAGVLGLDPVETLEKCCGPLLLHLRLDVPWLQSTAPGFDDLTSPVDELIG
jgi:HD-like signal output (HDOD) protein